MHGSDNVILVAQDLFFLPRVYNAAAPHGYEVMQAQTAERFRDVYEDGRTALVLVDLAGDAGEWQAVVERLTGEASRPRIVAFGNHADEQALEEAVALGCDAAMSNAQLSRDMVKIVQSLKQPAR
jgi:DNA-binding NarL/FixJ family response regulator